MNDIIESKDPEGLRLAFEGLRALLDEQTEIRRANTDIPKAVIFAASVGRMVLEPEVMIRVLEYHLGSVQRVLKRLASIRGGKGHADLASDLWRLGVLYEEYAAELAGDTRLYRAEDAARAKQYAQAINHVLGDATESDALVWNDTLSRAWTLLVNTYDEVAAAGRWLFRHENGEAMFPSLYTIGRQSRRRRQPEGGDELPGDELPGDDDEIEPAQPA